MKVNELQPHTIAWINFTDIVLSRRHSFDSSTTTRRVVVLSRTNESLLHGSLYIKFKRLTSLHKYRE